MKKPYLLVLVAVLGGIVLLFSLTTPALAHEDRPVGPYNFHVGWHVEPALVDQLNAVELTVTQNGQPVKDVESLREKLRAAKPGAPIVLQIERDGTMSYLVLESE